MPGPLDGGVNDILIDIRLRRSDAELAFERFERKARASPGCESAFPAVKSSYIKPAKCALSATDAGDGSRESHLKIRCKSPSLSQRDSRTACAIHL